MSYSATCPPLLMRCCTVQQLVTLSRLWGRCSPLCLPALSLNLNHRQLKDCVCVCVCECVCVWDVMLLSGFLTSLSKTSPDLTLLASCSHLNTRFYTRFHTRCRSDLPCTHSWSKVNEVGQGLAKETRLARAELLLWFVGLISSVYIVYVPLRSCQSLGIYPGCTTCFTTVTQRVSSS